MKVVGRVFWESDNQRVSNAIVVPMLNGAAHKAATVVTDIDGKFEVDLLDVGNWELTVFHREGAQHGHCAVDVSETTKHDEKKVRNENIKLASFNKTINQKIGYVFFSFLVCALLLLLWISYVNWKNFHESIVAPSIIELTHEIQLTVDSDNELMKSDKLRKPLAKIVELTQSPTTKLVNSLYRQKLANCASRVNTLLSDDIVQGALNYLKTRTELPASIVSAVDDLSSSSINSGNSSDNEWESVKTLLHNNGFNRDSAFISAIQETAKDDADQKVLNTFIGNELIELTRNANVLLEIETGTQEIERTSLIDWFASAELHSSILFWAILGTIVRLIMVTQRYLRFGRFYQQGMVQHFALLLCTPVLTLVFIKLVSLLQLSNTTGSINFTITDPLLMSMLAFVVALSPWSLWERLLGLGMDAVDKNKKG